MKNKVVIITGASSGIGKACALKFGNQGSKVVIAARNQQNLLETSNELKKNGIEILSIVADVAKIDDCKRIVDETVARFGKIDVLINNAGISMRSLFNETDLSVIEQVMQINFYGTVYCTKFALPHILASKGSVVGISSIAGFVGLPGRTGYSASKFAMHGFLSALRTENLKKEIHVMIACPGFTASNIRKTALDGAGNAQGESPRKEEKMMSPESVADSIYNGIVNRKNSVILTLEGKLAVFLSKFFPKWIEKMVFNKMEKESNSPLK